MFVVFFFQAEDGIRDTSVTGVQTCALPISVARSFEEIKRLGFDQESEDQSKAAEADQGGVEEGVVADELGAELVYNPAGKHEIGRASCREKEGTQEQARKGRNRATSTNTRA